MTTAQTEVRYLHFAEVTAVSEIVLSIDVLDKWKLKHVKVSRHVHCPGLRKSMQTRCFPLGPQILVGQRGGHVTCHQPVTYEAGREPRDLEVKERVPIITVPFRWHGAVFRENRCLAGDQATEDKKDTVSFSPRLDRGCHRPPAMPPPPHLKENLHRKLSNC